MGGQGTEYTFYMATSTCPSFLVIIYLHAVLSYHKLSSSKKIKNKNKKVVI